MELNFIEHNSSQFEWHLSNFHAHPRVAYLICCCNFLHLINDVNFYSILGISLVFYRMKRACQSESDHTEPSAKESSNVVAGYITDHTPPKQNGKHFYFDLQTDALTCVKSICFDNTKSPKIKQFLESGSPVKIKNITYQDDNSQYLAQLKVNTRSMITMADNSEVNFERISKPASSSTNKDAVTKIIDVQELKDDSVVTVQGLMTLTPHPPKEQKCRNGSIKLMLENNVLTDDTGSIKVTLWASNIKLVSQSIKRGHPHFLFKFLRVKSFLGAPKTLSTLSETEIEVLKVCPMELSAVTPTQPEDHIQMIDAKDIALVAMYTEYAQCRNCKRKITDIATAVDLKCQTCGASQRAADCNKKANIKVKLDVTGPWLTLFRNVWQDILPDAHGSEEVTNGLLGLQNITVVIDTANRLITQIAINEYPTQESSVQQQVQSQIEKEEDKEEVVPGNIHAEGQESQLDPPPKDAKKPKKNKK